MSVESFLKRVVQRDTAVYWSSPSLAVDGTLTYAAPVEIGCVWKEDIRRVKDFFEKEMVSRAHIYSVIDLDNQGMLFHGKLTDLTAGEQANPTTVQDAYEIRRFMKTPSLSIKDKYDRKSFI